jgi:hypothetical protein
VFQQLLALLPHELSTIAMVVASIGSLVGAALWLIGARFSRPILTLTAVALGTSVGLKLPLWCNWNVDNMGPAVGGAVILGVSAFALHRLWVGMWLGLVLACWTALGVWATLGHGQSWNWLAYPAGQTLPKYLSDLWFTLPAEMQKYLPWFAGVAMISGISIALAWPRIGMAFMWSAAGLSMLIALGAAALTRISPMALNHLPSQMPSQLTVLGGLVLLGAILQWRLMPQAQGAGAEESSEKSFGSGGKGKSESKK